MQGVDHRRTHPQRRHFTVKWLFYPLHNHNVNLVSIIYVSKPLRPRKVEKNTVNASTENADRTAWLERNKRTWGGSSITWSSSASWKIQRRWTVKYVVHNWILTCTCRTCTGYVIVAPIANVFISLFYPLQCSWATEAQHEPGLYRFPLDARKTFPSLW